MNNTTVVSGFINKNNDIFEFEVPELTLDREQVEQIISDTDPKEHSHQISEIAGLETQLANILDQLDNIPAQSPSGITINLDDEPTAGSNNAVKSGGVYNVLAEKISFNQLFEYIGQIGGITRGTNFSILYCGGVSKNLENALVLIQNENENKFYIGLCSSVTENLSLLTVNVNIEEPEDQNTRFYLYLLKNIITKDLVEIMLTLKSDLDHTHDIKNLSSSPFVTQLPSNAQVNDKYIYIGNQTNGLVFGQTYEYIYSGKYSKSITVEGGNYDATDLELLKTLFELFGVNLNQITTIQNGSDYTLSLNTYILSDPGNSGKEWFDSNYSRIVESLEYFGTTVTLPENYTTEATVQWTPKFAIKSELQSE